jgi:hypothetical protein
MWLTDDLHHTVRQFTPEGKLLLTLGDPDKPSTLHGGKPFNRPTHVALCPKNGDIYVSDGYGNSRVHKYDPKGRLLFSWGEPGTDPGCFNIPHNIATDAEGRVYVADRENHRVQIFDEKGKYLTQLQNLYRPCGALLRSSRRRPALRRRACRRRCDQRRGAQRGCPRVDRDPEGRAGRPHRRAIRRREAR